MNMDEPRDDEWMQSVVARFEGALLRYAQHLTGHTEAAREVVQDTFLRLCREGRAAVDDKLAEWLFTVCRHRAFDVRRKERRMTTMTEALSDHCLTDEPAAEQITETRDSFDHLQQVLATLSENQREVVRLKFQCGLSYREIAGVTQLSVSNVGFLLHTALKKLRAALPE